MIRQTIICQLLQNFTLLKHMKKRIAINGFGRIGKSAARILISQHPELELVAINSFPSLKNVGYNLKFDSVYRTFSSFDVIQNGDILDIKQGDSSQRIKLFSEKDPSLLPWKEMGIDIVLECSGMFRDTAGASQHLTAGAKKVIISAAAKSSEIKTVLIGVNETILDGSDTIISNASCTTNCVATLLKVLSDELPIRYVSGITVHAMTNSQSLVDSDGREELRDNRAAPYNLIPSSTGASKAVITVLPSMKDKLNITSVRVPVSTGSMVNLSIEFENIVTKDQLDSIIKTASTSSHKGIILYSQDELVSTDCVQTPYSCIYDSLASSVDNTRAMLTLWYDNEWGYTNRLVEMCNLV
jgi:glyceraldehyde 3-phosphate dehydrogenase